MKYPIAAGYVILTGFCEARPASNDLLPSNSGGLLMRSPAESESSISIISSIATNATTSTNLTLPIIPHEHRDFQPEISYSSRDTPKGIEFVASLAATVCDFWKDTQNQQISTRVISRQEPFNRFRYTIEPSTLPGTSLTPVKIGLAINDILQGVLKQPLWPGHVLAKLNDAATFPSHRLVDIGTLRVDNAPIPYVVGNGLGIPLFVEKRWLQCYVRPLLFFLTHAPSAMVTDDPYLPARDVRVTYHFPCGNGRDQFELTVYPDANAHAYRRLSWDRLLREMVVWINLVALDGEHRYLAQQSVKTNGVLQATMLIVVDLMEGEETREEVATA